MRKYGSDSRLTWTVVLAGCLSDLAASRSLSAMPRVVIGPAVPDRASLDNEIARLRGLDVGQLRARWHTVFRQRVPPHLPTCHAGRPQAAILWIHRGMSPPPEIDDFARLEANCSIFEQQPRPKPA